MSFEKKLYEAPKAYTREVAKAPEIITKEKLLKFRGVSIEVKGDVSRLVEELHARTGASLQMRPEGLHVTVIGPQDSKVLETITDEDAQELQKINEEIARGEGVQVQGIGYIDGRNTTFKMRGADLSKKVAFIALDIPRLQKFREKIGLPKKDFHITLGFELGDIHAQVTGQEEYKPGKFKEKREPIPKRADPQFDDLVPLIPELKFTGLSGKSAE